MSNRIHFRADLVAPSLLLLLLGLQGCGGTEATEGDERAGASSSGASDSDEDGAADDDDEGASSSGGRGASSGAVSSSSGANAEDALQVTLTPSSLALPVGGFASVHVSIERTGGWQGDVVVTLADAPSGVSADPLTLTDAATGGDLIVRGTGAFQPATARVEVRRDTLVDSADLALRSAAAGVDTAFGSGGNTTFDEPAEALAMQSDGKSLVMTESGLWRIDLSGNPDLGFGDRGFVAKRGVARQLPDGTLLIAVGGPSLTLTRLTASGQLDASFGAGGTLVVPGGKANASLFVRSVTVAADGSFWVGGSWSLSASPYTATGYLSHHAASGVLEDDVDADFLAVHTLAVADAGGGRTYSLSSRLVPNRGTLYEPIVAARDGETIATSFGREGMFSFNDPAVAPIVSDYGSYARGYLLPLGNGVFLHAANNTDEVWSKLTAQGARDTSYGNNGRPSNVAAWSSSGVRSPRFAVDRAGNLRLAAGVERSGSLELAAYDATGQAIDSYGNGGSLELPVAYGNDIVGFEASPSGHLYVLSTDWNEGDVSRLTRVLP